jgi:hypothetical protein
MTKENTELMEEIFNKIKEYTDHNNIGVKMHENILIKLKKEEEKTSRHVNSFQVDLALLDKIKEVYLVIIEVKGYETITTHDVLIYSSKAKKHKNLYPWLRYGIIWSSPKGKDHGIPRRFYMNNENLDFAFNFEGDINVNFKKFHDNILKRQIEISRNLYKILENKNLKTTYFSSTLDFGEKEKNE